MKCGKERKERPNKTREDGRKRIDEILDSIYEVETRNVDDGSELLQEELSSGEKEKILNMALDRIKAENDEEYQTTATRKTKSGSKKRGILVAALAAVFVFTTTVLAAEIFEWDNRIASYLGINANNSSALAESGMNIDVSAEQNGVTIKAIQTLGDANNMYILFEVTSPEGTKIDPNSRFDMIYLRVEGANSLGYGCEFLPDESENDNKATMLFSMDANNDINDKTIDLSFENLGHYNAESGLIIPDFEGTWELKWKLDYKDCSQKYPVNQELTVNGKKVNVDTVEISPIAINVKVSGDYIKEYDAVPPDPAAGELFQITAVKLKDGTVLNQEDSSGWGTSTHGDMYTINMKMKKLMDKEQIESITLNDTVITLK